MKLVLFVLLAALTGFSVFGSELAILPLKAW